MGNDETLVVLVREKRDKLSKKFLNGKKNCAIMVLCYQINIVTSHLDELLVEIESKCVRQMAHMCIGPKDAEE